MFVKPHLLGMVKPLTSFFTWWKVGNTKFHIDIGMYGIMVLCLLSRTMAFSSDNNTTDFQPSNDVPERRARDGDYIGCYPLGCSEFDYHAVLTNTTTPDTCTASCKENGFHIAALYNITECACSCEQRCLAKQMPDTHCGLPCRPDWERLCGGFTVASYYTVKPVNALNNDCIEHKIGETNGSSGAKKPPVSDFIPIYITTGIGSAVTTLLIIRFACLRKSDRRVIYTPRNHSRRWHAHASSQENKERPPNDPQTTRNLPRLPPRLPPRHLSDMHQSSGIDSTPHKHIRKGVEPTILEDIGGNMPVVESCFYHVLTEEGGEGTRSQGLSLATENEYAYAECRVYIDSLPRSADFIHGQTDIPRYPENIEEVEHEMVNNELYALYTISKK